MSHIYLDNNATTKLDPSVLEEMLPYLRESYGNPSSIQYRLGREASQAVEAARRQVAEKLVVRESEVFFNSGATEGVNTVLRGIASAYSRKGKHIITCRTEHKAVLNTCELLEKQGLEISYLSVDKLGNIDIQELRDTIREDTILVCLMAANNETGVIHPICEIADLCEERDVLYFCDATQLVGKENFSLQSIPIDILVFSAHKFHGPKGVGALYIRRKRKPIQIPPLVTGGQQEGGLRGGTLNVPNIVGLGKALHIASPHSHLARYRDYMEGEILKHLPEVIIHGDSANRLANTSNISFRHIKAAEIITALPDISVSSGSACASGLLDPSHVLKAMGYSDDDAFGSVRISMSKYTQREDIERATREIIKLVENIRASSPIWKLYKDGLIE